LAALKTADMKRARFVSLAAASSVVPRAAFAQSAPIIRIGAPLNDTAAEPYYAQELGYFKRAGLNVEVSTLSSGAAIAQAVAGGALEVGLTNVIGLATAIAKNIPFALVAAAGLYSTNAPTTAIAVAKTSPLRGPKDLEGKTVAVPALADMTYAAAASWLEKGGADIAKVKFVELPFPEANAALERGTVAAAMIAEPSLSAALHGSARLFGKAFDAIAPQFMVTAVFSTTGWLQKNPDAARKLTQAIYDAGRWANANHAQSGQILAARGKMDPDVVRTMTRATYALSADPALIQPALDIGYKFKIIDRPMTAADLAGKA
jgi:ABC-type nitrate/sulfonate/bicarbonate transport system substrate-binding protein